MSLAGTLLQSEMICQIVPSIAEEASGPSYSVPRLSTALAAIGHRVLLVTLDGGSIRNLGLASHLAFPQVVPPRKLGRSPAMRSWIQQCREKGVSLIHSHGLWMMPNIYPACAGVPHVIAPRGTLDPAALVYSRFQKQIVWHLLGQGAAARSAAALQATCEEEATHIRAQGLRQPIILSPNGIDIPESCHWPCGSRRTVLYLGRLHEKKGLDMLIAAWSRLAPAFPAWDLRIVGKGSESFEKRLARDVAARGNLRITTEGPLYGGSKLDAFMSADVVILPTRGENFGMVVAEALAAGRPVITTTAAPWSKLVAKRSGWWCSPNTDALSVALSQAMMLPRSELDAMGARGRAWMQEEYSWGAIGQSLAEAYRWILHGGARPANCLID